jgi:hypothetical protein
VVTPLSTIFQLYFGGQFYWWIKPEYPEALTFFLSKLGAIVLRYSSKDLMSPVLALYNDLIKVLLAKFMTHETGRMWCK